MYVNGRWTTADLGSAEAVFSPPSASPSLTKTCAQLSLELSASAYDLQIGKWQEAGWTDFSFQVDSALYTGSKINARHEDPVQYRISGLLRKLAQKRLQRNHPISQIYAAIRQKERSDTCKSLIMMHDLPGGHYLVAIGFMGTGKRMQDWISNFRMQKEEGMHQGFVQLAEEFESHASEIRFPHTAKSLGLDRLTLENILEECTRPGSRFRIWMAGHSQGAAIMQVFTRRLMEKGVLPQYITGCGFASPTVTYSGAYSRDPLYHLICSDDLTPRIGAKYHTGQCFVLPMHDALRAQCYQDHWQEDGFQCWLMHTQKLSDTRRALLFLIGFMRALSLLSDQDARSVLSSLGGKMLPALLIDMLGDSVSRVILRLTEQLTASYINITGESDLPLDIVQDHQIHILQHMQQLGAARFASILGRTLSLPHKLRDKKGGLSTYQRMVADQFSHLRPMALLPGGWPVLSPVVRTSRHPVQKRRYNALTYQRRPVR